MITIKRATATPLPPPRAHSPTDLDLDSDLAPTTSLVTPGEPITSDPQWMRGHGTFLSTPTPSAPLPTIISTTLGTITKTNKLLSITPLHRRYTPEIGDLVVGRIVEVQAKRWRVDINSFQHAALLLSSINLPGGILRKRTTTDELQIRTFFAEGELLVAEVQSLFADGSASLHTRSLKYGKLRNGYLLAVEAAGVVRSKSHVLAVATRAGEVEVVLGVNGYVWVAKKVVLQQKKEGEVSITRLEEEASEAIYSNRNEEIEPVLRREIARVGNCIRAMVRAGVRVEEGSLRVMYEAVADLEDESGEAELGKEFVHRVLDGSMDLS